MKAATSRRRCASGPNWGRVSCAAIQVSGAGA
jgi:hypothetical protein